MKTSLNTIFLFITIVGMNGQQHHIPGQNPLFTDRFTADPAPLVYNDTVFLYVGHDEAKGNELFNINQWLCYSSADMKNWTYHGPIMKATDFSWASRDAWASQVIEKGGKFYFYTTVEHGHPHYSKAIGVAVADNPTGPFKDARGTALITNDMTPWPHGWDDIDPTIFIDDDGTPWLSWGNLYCYLVKLKQNMTELDGPIQKIHLPNYTEGPWIHKRGDMYYLTYAAFAHQGFSEKVCYATAPAITGPWTYQGLITDEAENSFTIHPAIIEFGGQWYFFYHNAVLQLPNGQAGAVGRRSVCVEYLYYNEDGTIQPIRQSTKGISVPPDPNPQDTHPSEEVDGDRVNPNFIFALTQNIQPGITSWPGNPLIATVQNPAKQTSHVVGFYKDGGAQSIGQSFLVSDDIVLEKISLYAGDGMGTSDERPVSIALYDLGMADSDGGETYRKGQNLIGSDSGERIHYTPQAPGLIDIDFHPGTRVRLQAGHVYVFELQGVRQTAPIYMTRSIINSYPDGSGYRDRVRIENDEGSYDLRIAVYGSPAR